MAKCSRCLPHSRYGNCSEVRMFPNTSASWLANRENSRNMVIVAPMNSVASIPNRVLMVLPRRTFFLLNEKDTADFKPYPGHEPPDKRVSNLCRIIAHRRPLADSTVRPGIEFQVREHLGISGA